jgi:hypothetical protein
MAAMAYSSSERQIEILHELRATPRLFELLDDASDSELHLQNRLRREYPDELVRAAMTLHELRRHARKKFSRADEMWFDRTGLEQATAEPVALHKAQRFEGQVADYCCGMGSDCIALARRCDVMAVDVDPVATLYTKWNAEAYGVEARVRTICADVETLPAEGGLVHIDPDRRPGGRGRVLRVEDCRPGLEYLRTLPQQFEGGAIKLSPAGNFGGKFDDVEIELISLDGECKEATVWFGSLAAPGTWRATALPSGETIAGDPLEAFAELAEPGPYLYDPDPAVVRSGLVNLLAERLNLSRLDDAEEYLTADLAVQSPFVRGFEVLAELPNNDRTIRDYFRKSQFGQVEIKCRHIPIDADAVRRKLPLPGKEPAVLIFARVNGKARAMVCRRID